MYGFAMKSQMLLAVTSLQAVKVSRLRGSVCVQAISHVG